MSEPEAIPVLDWLRKLSEVTDAFRVEQVTPGQESQQGKRAAGWDYIVLIQPKQIQAKFHLYIETRSELTPQTALGIVEKRRCVPPDCGYLIASAFVSPRVAEICREKGVSYLDAVGNCLLLGPGLFILIERPKARRASVRPHLDVFSPKASRITRVLLSHPGRGWQVQALAQEASVSLGLASKVKSALVREAYAEERDRLVRVREPDKLLRKWADQYRPQGKILSLFTMTRLVEAETGLANWCKQHNVTYAVTQLSGAWRVAPMVRYDRSAVYIQRGRTNLWSVDELVRALGGKHVESGANLQLWLTDDDSVFSGRREVNGISVASPIQLYLDLRQLAGRGEEAAQEVFEREIRPLFDSVKASGS